MNFLFSALFIGLGIAHLTRPGADDAIPGIISLTVGLCLLYA